MVRRRLGLLREWKSEAERRAPLLPKTIGQLLLPGDLEILVEQSPSRIYRDAEYEAAGATLLPALSDADFVLGIKEIPIRRLLPNRPHLFFSHTIKGQAFNMPLLAKMLEIKATLIDYELVRDEKGKRLIFFGEQAGQAGLINSLWMLGRRLQALGIETPFAELRQARAYDSLPEASAAIERCGQRFAANPPKDLPLPLVIGVTGNGNVAKGIHGLLDRLHPVEVLPEELLAGTVDSRAQEAKILRVRFQDEHYARPRDGSANFDRAHYRKNPKDYVGRFHEFLPHLSLLVTGHYWEAPFPRLVTRDWLREAFAQKRRPRLLGIGDVTCDIAGSIASTVRASTPDDPLYVYDPATGQALSDLSAPGLSVMAVDILPTELPRDASEVFDRHLAPFVGDLVRADWSRPLAELEIAEPFRRAIIAHQGALTPEAEHLMPHLEALTRPPA